MMKMFTEEQWFNEFYPKEWGDWRKVYNMSEYMNQFREGYEHITGCCWMDYSETGWVRDNHDGTMGVVPNRIREYEESFFIESDKDFCQPYFQPKDNTYYLKVIAERMESNLDLYSIYVAGNDDCSYTRHCIGLNAMREAIEDLKKYGTSNVSESDSYFFSN